MSEFGRTLKRLMNENKLTVNELGERINVSPKSLSEWVAKGRMPRDPEVLKRLSEELGVSVHMLLYGVDDASATIATLFQKTLLHTGTYEITVAKVEKK